MLKLRLTALAVVVTVSGCAGRAAVPVGATQVGDQELSCRQLQSEITRNEQQAQSLYEQHKKAGDANIAIGVVGALLFWPALFALDTGTAEKDEARALEARNAHLHFVEKQNGCGAAGGTSKPPAPVASPAPAPAPAPAAPARPAVPARTVTAEDRLRSLQDMLDRKAITRTEFEAKRNAILASN